MLSNVAVRAAINDGRIKIEEKAMLNAEDVVQMLCEIATADPAELMGIHIGACRYCHGNGHEYHWTSEREYRELRIRIIYDLFRDDKLRVAALQDEIVDPRIPTDAGGYGYRISAYPNLDCPECAGLGIERVRIADTRTLSVGAKLLYNGVEQTRQGKKIKIQDRSRALENLAKCFGMFSGKVEAEGVSSLSRLVDRIMDSASSVPIGSDVF